MNEPIEAALWEFVLAQARERVLLDRLAEDCTFIGDGRGVRAAKLACHRAASRLVAVAATDQPAGEVVPFPRPEPPSIATPPKPADPLYLPLRWQERNADGTLQPVDPDDGGRAA